MTALQLMVAAILAAWPTRIAQRVRQDDSVVREVASSAQHHRVAPDLLLSVGLTENGLDTERSLTFGAMPATVRALCAFAARCEADPTGHRCHPGIPYPDCTGDRLHTQVEVATYVLAVGLRECGSERRALTRYNTGYCAIGPSRPRLAAAAADYVRQVSETRAHYLRELRAQERRALDGGAALR